MKKQILFISLLSLFIACRQSGNEKRDVKKVYFDLQGFFSKEEARLKKAAPFVYKTVSVNDETEHKLLRIKDWHKELSIFTDADINKMAWIGLFKVQKLPGMEIYTSNNKKVPVKLLKIMFSKNNVTGIEAQINNSNLLYASADTLMYFPDSTYKIKKVQHIKLLPEKKYEITGKF